MHAQMTIIRDLIHGAAARGADIRKMCADIGIPPEALNDSEQKVPFDPAARIWDVCVEHTQDPLLGLHLAEHLSPTILGMIGYLMQSCSNLREGIESICKFWPLFSTMSNLSVHDNNGFTFLRIECAIEWQHRYPDSERQSIDLALGGACTLFRTLSGKTVVPVRAEFTCPSRAIHEYERHFRTSVHFKKPVNQLVFRKRDLLTPVLSYDKSLFKFFNTTLEQKLRSLQNESKLSDQLTQLIIVQFKGQVPSVEVAAAHLNMTHRSLQRKLSEEGTTYRALTACLKKELVQSMMKSKTFRPGDAARLLGYADSSSFRKAFKKW
jgi:AraC-like DNA-binding protein